MERRPAVVLHSVDGRVRLRFTARCSLCAGCGGRCNVFNATESDELELQCERRLSAGDRVSVEWPRRALLAQALLGYGVPLAGLLAGALALHSFGNVAAAIGALAGTLLAVSGSKRLARRVTLPRLVPQMSPGDA